MASTEESPQPNFIDKDSKMGNGESGGSKISETEVMEQNPANSEQEDKDSKSGPAESSGLQQSKPKVTEANSAKSEQEDKDSRMGNGKFSGSKIPEPEVRQLNPAKSKQEMRLKHLYTLDKDSKSDPAESSGLNLLEPKVTEANSAKSEQEDKDSKRGPAESSGLQQSESKENEPNPEKLEQEVNKLEAETIVREVIRDIYKSRVQAYLEKELSEIQPHSKELIIPSERVLKIYKKLASEIYLDEKGAIRIKLEESEESVRDIKDKKPLENIQYSDNTYREVKVTVPLPSGATDRFFEAFQTELMKRGIRAVWTDVLNFTDAATTDVVMIICHNSSRLEANVKSALSSLDKKQYNRIFLVVFHMNKKLENLQQSSKEQLQDIQEFCSFNNIVDIACDKDGKVFTCELNDKAFKEIEKLNNSRNFLTRLFHWRPSKSF